MFAFRTVCLVLAGIAFVLAAIGVQSRFNLIGLGLALWILSLLVA